MFDENIAYGFRRNLLGMKPIAIVLCLLVLAAHAALLWLRPLDQETLWTGAILAVSFLVFISLWVFLVTKDFVEDASEAYALRLFSFCESDPPKPTGSKGKSTSRRSNTSNAATDTQPTT